MNILDLDSKVEPGTPLSNNPLNPVPYHTHNGIDSPRLSDTGTLGNLLDLTDTPDSYIGESGKAVTVKSTEDGVEFTTIASSPKTATFVIGPSSNSDSSTYDYVTDGTNDDVEIQAAITALPATGGSICLREGTYTLGSAAVIISQNGVELYGVGKGTIVTCKTNFANSFFILGDSGSTGTQFYNCTIRDIYFDGNGANQNTSSKDKAIIDNNYAAGKGMNNLVIANCYFVNSYSQCITTQTGTPIYIHHNYFLNWLGNQTALTSAAIYSGNTIVYLSDNYFSNTSTSLKYVYTSQDVLTNNYFDIPTSYNATAVEFTSGGFFNSNFISAGATLGSSCILVKGNSGNTVCISNNISVSGTGSNATSTAFSTCGLVSNNLVSNIGKACNNCALISDNKLAGLGDVVVCDAVGPTRIIGNTMSGANKLDNTYSIILIKNGGFEVMVIGNKIADGSSGGNIAAYGLKESTSSEGPTIVTGNIFQNNFKSGAMLISNPLSDVSHNITS